MICGAIALPKLKDLWGAIAHNKSGNASTGTMTAQTTEYKYICLNENGVPTITGTTMKVVELITAQFAYGWSPEELHLHYPHLSMSQIHSALAYYWDHKDEIDADRERRFQLAEAMRREAGKSPLVAKLRAKGLIQ